MKNLAIIGHKVRGKEVIELLQMLGGVNSGACTGNWPGKLYALTDSGIIDYIWAHEGYNLEIFTLEAFENNYPYKIGDLVRTEYCEDTYCKHVITGMTWNGSTVVYSIDNAPSILYDVSELKPYVENEQEPETLKVDIPKGYEFAGVDDNAGQVILQKIQPVELDPSNKIIGLVQETEDRYRLVVNYQFDIKADEGEYYLIRRKS